MAERAAPSLRPDVDILEDLHRAIGDYPPLVADRRRYRISIDDGHVTLSGHVRTPINRRTLIERVQAVADVQSVTTDDLHDDETIRIAAGQAVPAGMSVIVEYGAVILSGRLPAGAAAEPVVERVLTIPGVTRVVTALRS
ncbi:MAG: BON domain-containing protein [Chloroflexi bacterium]|nr:BON domain-containing protein [Chloroflexota bacterium]